MTPAKFTFERKREEVDGRRHEYTVTEIHDIELNLADDGVDGNLVWEWEDEGHPGSGDHHEISFKFTKERTKKIDTFLDEEDAFYELPYVVYKWLIEQGIGLPESLELPESEKEPEPPKQRIVISVRDGIVSAVYVGGNPANVEILVADTDQYENWAFDDGMPIASFPDILPMSEMSGILDIDNMVRACDGKPIICEACKKEFPAEQYVGQGCCSEECLES